MLKLIILISLGLVYSLDTNSFFDQVSIFYFYSISFHKMNLVKLLSKLSKSTFIKKCKLSYYYLIYYLHSNNVGKVVNFLKTM